MEFFGLATSKGEKDQNSPGILSPGLIYKGGNAGWVRGEHGRITGTGGYAPNNILHA